MTKIIKVPGWCLSCDIYHEFRQESVSEGAVQYADYDHCNNYGWDNDIDRNVHYTDMNTDDVFNWRGLLPYHRYFRNGTGEDTVSLSNKYAIESFNLQILWMQIL